VAPSDASAEYLDARSRLLAAERSLLERCEQVAALRRRLPAGPSMPEYVFDEGPRDLTVAEPMVRTSLSELVTDRSLVVYHKMYGADWDDGCPSCSMWVDGLHGVSQHLLRRVDFAVIAKAPLPRLRAWGRKRGWDGLRLLSSSGSTFNRDLGVEDEAGNQWPGVSVFVRDGTGVRHTYTTSMIERGLDLLSPVWQVLDLTPEGRGDWDPANSYAGRVRGS
jgi:predicted dithiol-disulfide oxidoreductase (DUF899 family)